MTTIDMRMNLRAGWMRGLGEVVRSVSDRRDVPGTLHQVHRPEDLYLQVMFAVRLKGLDLTGPLALRVDTEAAVS